MSLLSVSFDYQNEHATIIPFWKIFQGKITNFLNFLSKSNNEISPEKEQSNQRSLGQKFSVTKKLEIPNCETVAFWR